jgi:putative SOS response-associated peptidase YedK
MQSRDDYNTGMCGRYTLHARLNRLLQQFAVEAREGGITPLWDEKPRYNIAPTQQVPIIRQIDGHRELSMVRWGLIPPWADPEKPLPMMNNARSEEVTAKPTFKSIIKNKRCLIIADGFYEWETIGKIKQPHYFGLRGYEPFAFAGLWQTWHKGDKPVDSCTIMTTSANELVGEIHDRMPVILSPDDYDLWLDPEMQEPAKLTRLYKPFAASEMESHLVSMNVNKVANQGAELIEPIETPGGQQELF